jgi:predicted RNA-binding Zn ribbon-like protein
MRKSGQAPVFDISAGHLALDFANTVSKRPSPRRQEHLLAYSDLIHWASQAGAISSREAIAISRRADRIPRQAAVVLEQARQLRESVHRIFSALAAAAKPPARDVRVLNAGLQRMHSKVELRWASRSAVWRWSDAPDSLQRILWTVLDACADLLTSEPRPLIRECEAENCAWLFIDRSKNRSRRWCDMKVCGNREKAKRFYRRKD